ncbi:MAG: tetratricopeptide repeat protein [Prevotella sp.]|uniref:tetratricopeptide repeat protein n=1 Tax=Prevotella sp. TaxID=59823 RepID=UPI002A291F3C|nr:tetratricopeptide repeat protein [Prevotella sp.]MDD7317642.1 tetratricopeptide repeat protein [Prevotellaceae bacterium]MDY4020511.1 tetratricopeptide repeat protein [Prevotella sp.]
MNLLKALFGGKAKTPEEEKKDSEEHDFNVLKYDGKQALVQGNTGFAVKCLTHALNIKDDPETRDYLSQALIKEGDMLKAYEQLQKLSETEPDNVKIYMRMANVSFVMEDYNAMANACEKAMLVDKDMPELMYLYAQACVGLGDTSNAVAMLTKAINLREDYGDAYLLRGETLLENGNTEGAEEDADWLMEHHADIEEALLLKARLEKTKGNADNAIEVYGKVIDINPFSIDAYRERAAVKLEKGDQAGHDEDMQKASEISPEVNEEDIEKEMEQKYKDNNPYGF